MSTYATEAQVALQKAKECVTWLAVELGKCQEALTDCKAKLTEKPKADGPAPELLREFVQALSDRQAGAFAKKHGHDVPVSFSGPEELWAFCGNVATAVLKPGPKPQKAEGDAPSPELLREFVEAVATGVVSDFAPRRGWADLMGFQGSLVEYHREIARLVLRPKDFKAWEAKYYPVPAKEVPKERAARATLLKYQGVLPEVLKEYGLVKKEDRGVLVADDKRVFICNETTCALCVHYDSCQDCPLRSVTNGRTCYLGNSVYRIWTDTGDVSPLIKALEKAVELEKERENKAAVPVARDPVDGNVF